METQEDVRTTRTLAPNDLGGRLVRNFDLTTPELPCGRVTRLFHLLYLDEISRNVIDGTYPQITRTFEP